MRHNADLDLLENSLEVAQFTGGDHGNGCASLASTPCPTTPANTGQMSHISADCTTKNTILRMGSFFLVGQPYINAPSTICTQHVMQYAVV